MIKQPQNQPLDQIDEAIMLLAIKEKIIKWIPIDNFDDYKAQLIIYLQKLPLREELQKKKEFDQDLTNRFVKKLKEFTKNYILGIQGYDMKQYGSSNELEDIGEEPKK
jgi:F-type H+-transporting ATPase subunit alpha